LASFSGIAVTVTEAAPWVSWFIRASIGAAVLVIILASLPAKKMKVSSFIFSVAVVIAVHAIATLAIASWRIIATALLWYTARHQAALSKGDHDLHQSTMNNSPVGLVCLKIDEFSGLYRNLLFSMQKVGIFICIQKHERGSHLAIQVLMVANAQLGVAGTFTVVNVKSSRFLHCLDLEIRVPVLVNTQTTTKVHRSLLNQAADKVRRRSTSGPETRFLGIGRVVGSIKDGLNIFLRYETLQFTLDSRRSIKWECGRKCES
jgi:hypothetical protein